MENEDTTKFQFCEPKFPRTQKKPNEMAKDVARGLWDHVRRESQQLRGGGSYPMPRE
jgi:hypothetical protein